MVTEIKENEFAEKIKEGKVLVDFYAEWCGPCKMLAPIVEEVSVEVTNYTFYKVNVDEAPEIARKLGIMSIPTLIKFENGEQKDKSIGLRTKEDLIEWLNK